jgi:hypothetical protein
VGRPRLCPPVYKKPRPVDEGGYRVVPARSGLANRQSWDDPTQSSLSCEEGLATYGENACRR